VPFDPEGLLGTLPSAVNVLAGCAAATIVRRGVMGWKLVGALALAGVLLVCLSAVTSPVLPINKKLWTASYVLCTAGLDLVVLSLLLTVLDVMKLRSGAGYFEVLGKNTLALYMLAELSMSVAWTVQIGAQPLFMWLYDHVFRWAGDKPGSLLFALVFAQACWTVGWLMDRNRIYIKL
jgi:predicted acyltransferase